jgi:hypothetical protein
MIATVCFYPASVVYLAISSVIVLEKMLDDDVLDMMVRAAFPSSDNTDSSIIIIFTRGKDGFASIAVYARIALTRTWLVVGRLRLLLLLLSKFRRANVHAELGQYLESRRQCRGQFFQ